jgi:hypothetical protein
MNFTNLGVLVARFILIIGIIQLAMGISVATGILVEPEPGRYLGSNTSGQAIDKSLYYLFFAICLGVLTDISKSVTKGDKE